MRILKYIAVFTPEPWQGYGFDDRNQGACSPRASGTGATSRGPTRTTPRCRRPGGDYDGKFLFIGDKANARLAVIDLDGLRRPSRS